MPKFGYFMIHMASLPKYQEYITYSCYYSSISYPLNFDRMLHLDVLLFVCAVLHVCVNAQGNSTIISLIAILYNR